MIYISSKGKTWKMADKAFLEFLAEIKRSRTADIHDYGQLIEVYDLEELLAERRIKERELKT